MLGAQNTVKIASVAVALALGLRKKRSYIVQSFMHKKHLGVNYIKLGPRFLRLDSQANDRGI